MMELCAVAAVLHAGGTRRRRWHWAAYGSHWATLRCTTQGDAAAPMAVDGADAKKKAKEAEPTSEVRAPYGSALQHC
jgi:hypothetical protein